MMANEPETSARPAFGRGAQLALVAVAVVAALALFWPRSSRTADRAAMLIDREGHSVPLAPEFAPVTIVHFWASWCPPCRTELPELVRFARRQSSPRVRVLFIAVADDPAAATQFLGADDLPLFFDPAWNVAQRFGTSQLPESHLVVGGEIVRTFVGATPWESAAIGQELQKWTASPARAEP